MSICLTTGNQLDAHSVGAWAGPDRQGCRRLASRGHSSRGTAHRNNSMRFAEGQMAISENPTG